MLYYTDEKNAQIVLASLKEMNVKKIVVSPGNTNIPISEGVKHDSFFQVFSSVDERSAAYLACGLSQESGEPVALSCTGATASRNYMPGLTEAFYKKLPIVAITSTNGNENIGNLIAQNLDRSAMPNDIVNISVQLPVVKDDKDFWQCKNLTNRALIMLEKNGGGPVHINLPTSYMGTFTTKELPKIKMAKRRTIGDEFPIIDRDFKIAIFIGSHKRFTPEETVALEKFCKVYNAVVLCDHTSGYYGKYKVISAIAALNAGKDHYVTQSLQPDLIIHIGEISGDYATTNFIEESEARVWRVSNDGEIRDTFKKLDYIFDCEENDFFSKMVCNRELPDSDSSYLELWRTYIEELRTIIPELPFSNISIAKSISNSIPKNSNIDFGILNSLRSNNFFEYDSSIVTNSNVGGFGIDGCLSTIIGASLISPEKLHFLVVGDLAFFYDMNVLGNRHVGNNLRILLINNGGGGEFKNFSHLAAVLGEEVDEYVAAVDHFQGCSNNVSPARAWTEALGFDYISAHNTEEFKAKLVDFYDTKSKSIIFECFTNFKDDSDALKILTFLDKKITFNGKLKQSVKNNLSHSVKSKIKKIVRK